MWADLPPSLGRRLDELEARVDKVAQSWGRVTITPSGAIAATSGLLAPLPGGQAVSTLVDVQAVTPAQPAAETGVDEIDGAWLRIIPPDLDATGQIVQWLIDVEAVVAGNRLGIRSQSATPSSDLSSSNGSVTSTVGLTLAGRASHLADVTWSAAVILSTPTVTLHPTGAVVAGTQFTSSAWVRAVSGTWRSAAVAIEWRTATDTVISTSTGTSTVMSGSAWQQRTVTAVAPAGAAKARLLVVTGTGAAGDKFAADLLVLRAGDSTFGLDATAAPNHVLTVQAGEQPRLTGLSPAGEAAVRVAGVSRLGVRTAWSSPMLVTLAADDVPPTTTVTGLQAAKGPGSITLWWSDSGLPADIDVFEAQISTSSDFSSGVTSRRAITRVTGFDQLANGVYWLRVRPIDRAGNAGPWAVLPGTVVVDGATTPGPAAYEAVIVGALIADATIGSAKIRELTADKIRAGTIGAETIVLAGTTSSRIRSSNYAPGSAGWQIDGAGNAELNNVTVRGTVASSTISSSTISSSTISSSTFSSTASGVTMTLSGRNLTWSQSGYANHFLYKDGNDLWVGGYRLNLSNMTFVDGAISRPAAIHMRDNTIYLRDPYQGQTSEFLGMWSSYVRLSGFQYVQIYGSWADATAQLQSDGNFVLYDDGSAWGMKSISAARWKDRIETVTDDVTPRLRALRVVQYVPRQDWAALISEAEQQVARATTPAERELAERHLAKRRWAEQRWRTDREWSIIAEEVEQVFPGLTWRTMDSTGPEGYLHTRLTMALLKGWQELEARVTALEQGRRV